MTIKFSTYFSAILLILACVATSCKKRDNQPEVEVDRLTLLKQQVSGEWEMSSGVYQEFDQQGKVSYSENLPHETPAPWYDLRKADLIYIADRHGRQGLAYSLSISAEGIARIKLAESSWDISRTYDITAISATQMSWVEDRRYTDQGADFTSRVRTQYNFTKR